MKSTCIGVVRNKKGEITDYKIMSNYSNGTKEFSIEYIENNAETLERIKNQDIIIDNIFVNCEGHIVYLPRENTLGAMINSLDVKIISLLKKGEKVELMHYDNWEFNEKREITAWTSDNITNEIERFSELVGWTYSDVVEHYCYHLREMLERDADICVSSGLKNIFWLNACHYECMAYTHIVLSSRIDDMAISIDDYNKKLPMTSDNYMYLQEDFGTALGISAWAIGGLKKKRVIRYHENEKGIIDRISFTTDVKSGEQCEEELIRYKK
ncbi:MAG: hypothetical protein IJN54_09165 [Lachnospiraceae bacterium]|nr:hypothetical protein [Lachnospiraceae bacterium]